MIIADLVSDDQSHRTLTRTRATAIIQSPSPSVPLNHRLVTILIPTKTEVIVTMVALTAIMTFE